MLKGLVLARTPLPAAADGMGPGALLPVANKPMLAYALEALSAAGIHEVAVAVDARLQREFAAAVGDGGSCGVSVTFVPCENENGSRSPLLAAREFLDGSPFAAVSAHALLRRGLREAVDAFEGQDLEALFLVADRQRGESGDGGGRFLASTERVMTFERGPRPAGRRPPNERGVVAGVLDAGVLDRLTDADTAGDPLELDGALCCLTRAGARVRLQRSADAWSWEGDADALLAMNHRVLDAMDEDFDEDRLEATTVQGRVAIHPTASVEAATVRGPAIIGAGARVTDAYIGPYTAIGPDVVLEGAEIEYSIVLQGASIRHVGTRLETSVIGSGARVSRSFALPGALRLRIGAGAEVRLT